MNLLALFKKVPTPKVYPVPVPPPPPELPPLNARVVVQLSNGAALNGYWNGVQWWAVMPGMLDLPVVNDSVRSWYIEPGV